MKTVVQIVKERLKCSSGGAERHYRGSHAKSEPEAALLRAAPSTGWEHSGLPSTQPEKSLYFSHRRHGSSVCLALPFQCQCFGLLPSALQLTNRSHNSPEANNMDVFTEALPLGDFLSEFSCDFFSPQVRPSWEDPGPPRPTCESLCLKPSVTIQ